MEEIVEDDDPGSVETWLVLSEGDPWRLTDVEDVAFEVDDDMVADEMAEEDTTLVVCESDKERSGAMNVKLVK